MWNLLRLVFLWFVLPAQFSLADCAPSFEKFDLIQKGQGVEIGPLRIKSLDRVYGLFRRHYDTDENEVLVQEKVKFKAKDAVESFDSCRGTEQFNDCLDAPETCLDCDGDGLLECPEEYGCQTSYEFLIWDECVEPGRVLYQLRPYLKGGEYREVPYMVGSIDIENLDQTCPVETSASCSWSPNPQMGLGIFTLLLGGLLTRRKTT